MVGGCRDEHSRKVRDYIRLDHAAIHFASNSNQLHRGCFFVGPLQRVRPRNGILALGLGLVVVLVVVPLRSEFIGEL